MIQITRSETIKFSPKQMFDLVNDISSYHHFIPWCEKSVVLDGVPDVWMLAKLTFNFHGIQQSFTTRNELLDNHAIDINLVSGPFEHLKGKWQFLEHASGCKILLDLEYKFLNTWLSGIFEPAFKQVSDLLVVSFKNRACKVYD